MRVHPKRTRAPGVFVSIHRSTYPRTRKIWKSGTGFVRKQRNLLIPESFNRIKPGSANGRIDAEDQANGR